MATRIGKLDVRPTDLDQTKALLEAEVAAAKAQTGRVEWDTGVLMGERGRGEEWGEATRRGWGRNESLAKLVEEVAPHALAPLQQAWAEQARLATAVASFEALCQSLGAAQQRTDRAHAKPVQSVQVVARQGILEKLAIVRRAVEAAGPEFAQNLNTEQLDSVERGLKKQIAALEANGAGAVPVLLRSGDVDTAEKAAAAIAKALDRPELAEKLAAIGRQGPREGKILAGWALLLDQAASAPDYRVTGAGAHYPRTRIHYRQRLQQPQVAYIAEKRQLTTQQAAAKQIAEALDSKAPGAQLEHGLMSSFVKEIGVDLEKADRAGWQPNAMGIVAALEHELLLPLRAINENLAAMDRAHPNLQDRFTAAVDGITRAVVEGQYRNWRYESATGQEQLKVLDAAGRKAWRDSNVSVEVQGPHGKLKTREEDGLDLFWVTKIGGPSHGFDYNAHCLLPLLANARSKPIVVVDSTWPEHPAGRAYLRLLSTPDGRPFLYLEPTQRDFTHRDLYPEAGVAYQQAIFEHALAKAQLLGLPLSVDAALEGAARGYGLNGHRQERPSYYLAPSGGVLEASDTLTDKHDWPQYEGQIVQPFPRFWIEAKGQ